MSRQTSDKIYAREHKAAQPAAGPLGHAWREFDWPEDSEDKDNGQYLNRCITCDRQFIGHKRRNVCKLCANPVSLNDLEAQGDDEQPAAEQAGSGEVVLKTYHIDREARTFRTSTPTEPSPAPQQTAREWASQQSFLACPLEDTAMRPKKVRVIDVLAFEELADRCDRAEAELGKLADPVSVHINMLRGTIAVPSRELMEQVWR